MLYFSLLIAATQLLTGTLASPIPTNPTDCTPGLDNCDSHGGWLPGSPSSDPLKTRDLDMSKFKISETALKPEELEQAKIAGKVVPHMNYWCDEETALCYPNPLDYGGEPPAKGW